MSSTVTHFPILVYCFNPAILANRDSKLYELKLLISVSRSLFHAGAARARRWVCILTLQVGVPDWSRGIVVGRLRYGLDTQGVVVRFPAGAKNLFPIERSERRRFARKQEERLHRHDNVEAIQLLDNSALLRRLNKIKPFELAN